MHRSRNRPVPLVLALCALLFALAGARADTAPATPAVATVASPFADARVELREDLGFVLEWKAPDARRVEIFAATEPEPAQWTRHIASGRGAGKALITTLPVAPRWFFAFVADGGTPLVLAERSLQLPSASNFRDAGGYRTADGRWVRMGLAYRSNALRDLMPEDLRVVNGLGIRLVCDLRRESERKRQPDPPIGDATYLVADVMADLGKQATAVAATGAPADPSAAYVASIDAAYRDFVNMESARTAYHTLFTRLADHANLPTVFHCTAGKDRAGWAQAILLSILGVPRETIRDDFAATDLYLSAEAKAKIAAALPPMDPETSRRALAADPAYLDVAFHEAETRYGSMDGYVRDGLKLDEKTIAAIRATFLTP